MDTETKEMLMRDDRRRQIIRQYGYEIDRFIAKGGNGYVYGVNGNVYGTSRELALKFIERGAKMPEEFRIYVQSEFEEGRAMAELGVGIPVYDAHYGQDYGIIVMERGIPVGFDMRLDRSYFREVFKKIDAINKTGNWCVDFKPINTVMWKGKPYLIDFDQDFCERLSQEAFWKEWTDLLEHYQIEAPDNLFTACDIPMNEATPQLEMYLAQCYMMYMYAIKWQDSVHLVSGYITALHDVLYGVKKTRGKPHHRTRHRHRTRQRTPPRRSRRRPTEETKSKTWADTWQETVDAVMSYLTPAPPARRRQHIRSKTRR